MALHGFAGTGRMWEPAGALMPPDATTLWCPDLPGHGGAAGRRPADVAAAVGHVLAIAPERFALAGYSMGGRIALHIALAAPERVTRLVLIATTAGIVDADERARRRAADEALAAAFETLPIEQIADRWTAQPLFAGDPAPALARQRADVLRNRPAGLAAALRGMGVGATAPVWDRLDGLTMPATVLVGERDETYVALGRRLAAALPAAEPPLVVPGAGHGLPREDPATVAAALLPS